jgi:hypothetical protein
MDEDIAFLKRVQSYIPIVTWNFVTVGMGVFILVLDLRHWWLSILFVILGLVGNYIWIRWRAAHKDRPSRFFNIEGFQLVCNAIGFVWFGIWAIIAFQPWKLLVCAMSGFFLVFRLKVRADKQARLRRETSPPQLN